MNFNTYYAKNFYEKFKDFHTLDAKFFADYLDSNMPISKSMHPIIAYNFPEIVEKFCRTDDLRNIIRSPSIMLHYKRENLYSETFTEEDFLICEIIKGINNKTYNTKDLNYLMDKYFSSKRQRSIYAKSYPELHEKFATVQDNFDYNMCLIAIEQCDKSYIEQNLNYIKENLKDKFIENCDFCFGMLEPDDYTDEDVLRFIYDNTLVQYLKSPESIFKFWEHHSTTKYTTISTLEMLEKAIELKLDIANIDDELLNEHAKLVISHSPYFYAFLDELHLENEEIKKLALRDPYNVGQFKLDESNIKHFLNCSNINITDAFWGLQNSINGEYNTKLILKQIDKFEGVFLALQSYPLFILLLSKEDYKKHVTPYLINHACKMDKEMFKFFKESEEYRWK